VKFITFFVSALVLTMAGGNHASADAANDSAAGDASALQEIVVTAQRRTEDVQKVPIALTTFNSTTLEQTGIRDTRDLQFATPSMSIGEQVGAPTASIISIRGQVQTDAEITVDPSVGVYFDDVYLGRANGQISELFDIDSVEVLLGPQGTLYGRNTTGGALKISTKQADPSGGISGYGGVGFGNYDYRDYFGAINLPLIDDKLAIRLAVLYREHDGYTKDYVHDNTPFAQFTGVVVPTDDEDFRGYRANAVWKPTDTLKITLAGDYTDITSNGQLTHNAYGDVFNPLTFQFSFSPQAMSSFYAGENNYIPYADLKQHGESATGDLDLGFMQAKLIIAHRDVHAQQYSDIDGSGSQLITYFYDLDVNQNSAELQLSGNALDNRLKWLFGAYSFEEMGFEETFSPAFFGLQTEVFASDDENRSNSAFVHAQYQFTDQLSAFAGFRYTVDDKGTVGLNRQQIGNGPFNCLYVPGTAGLTIISPTDCSLHENGRWDFPSWSAGLNYQITPDVLTYIKTDRATRSGGQQDRGVGFDPLVPTPGGGRGENTSAPFQPETATDVEVGIKSELFDRHLRVNADYYHTWYKDQQIENITVLPTFHSTTTVIINLPGTTIYDGFELQTAARIGDFGIDAGASWINWKESEPTLFQPAMTPKAKGSITPNYTKELEAGTLRASVSWSYTGVQFSQAAKALENSLRLDSYRIINADLSFELKKPNFKIDFWGKNIAGEKYYNFSTAFNPEPGLLIAPEYIAPPATYGVELTEKF
jgi:iron complex outermembrane receptor protein